MSRLLPHRAATLLAAGLAMATSLVVAPASGAVTPSSITLVSGNGAIGSTDPATDVSLDNGTTYQPARIVRPHPLYSVIPGTNYVSDDSAGEARQNTTTLFRTTFSLPAGFVDPSLTIDVHADNVATLRLNGAVIGQQPTAHNLANFQNPAESFSTSGPARFQEGLNTLEFSVENSYGPMGLDYLAVVTFIPNTAPDCSNVSLDRTELWPPNNELVTVTASGATDIDAGDTVSLVVDGVRQDEPTSGGPDAGLTAPLSSSAAVRAERDGGGDGRVYRLHFLATDSRGATCSGELTVGVPHDQSRPAVDSFPASFDSLV